MAKWGEGDPRWIVEERPDATNVNNWHWAEKNASDWSKNKFTELLVGLSIDLDDKLPGKCEITEISRSDGDASANNRKAKLIFFFEWHLQLKFEAFVRSEVEEEKFTGLIEIPNLSDENTAEEVDVDFKVDSSGDKAYALKEILRKKMTAKIRTAIGEYINQLKKEYGKDLILPTKDSVPLKPQQSTKITSAGSSNGKNLLNSAKASPSPANQNSVGSKISVRDLNLTENFMCTANELFGVFTRPEMVQAFTRAPCQVDACPGGRFSLFSGHIEGKFSLLSPGVQLDFDWRAKNWPAGHFSLVSLKFHQKEQSTELQLNQSQVPEDHYENAEDGWRRHYFNAIKQTFGFGSKLF